MLEPPKTPPPAPAPRALGTPDLGVGAGLRVKHYQTILDTNPEVGFFEAISENYLVEGGKPLYYLDQIAERYPIVLHGVSLSIGGPDEPDRVYLKRLKALAKRVDPAWVTDHFCFGSAHGVHVHDLLPLPYTAAMVKRVATRLRMLSDYLERPVGLENTSSYLSYRDSEMTEWEFLTAVVDEADAGLLLDVNNIFVSAFNHGFDPLAFLRGIPGERVLQIHMAGHTNYGKYIIDTHRGPVPDLVMDLYYEAIRTLGATSTLLEWDDEIPPFSTMVEELARLGRARERALSPGAPPLTGFVMPSPDSSLPSSAVQLSGDGAATLRDAGGEP